MALVVNRKLDEIDEHLLSLLDKNARKPVVALAKAVGLSRTAVQGRLARLEDEGTIRGYTVVRGRVPDDAPVKALLLLCIGTRPCATVIRRFEDWPEVTACWSVAGPTIDAVLMVKASSNEALGEVRARLAEVPGVTSITTAPILKTVVERRA
ncbi:Lrp/AsnC family transcriptional regulator [Sphingomonas sp. GCM10030256]|uniref:Lrp/AsnC family transcriptional regulator n=1 Tax=Sphingomonas sp. GCM10030256 TaxID=3273427 RepID=UPI003612722F